MHRWWSLPARSKPSLLAGQRWLEWSRSCLSFNWLRWVGRLQSPSIGLSIDEWVPAKIENHRKDCASSLLMPNTCHSPWSRPQHCAWGLASSSSLLGAHRFFWCQNGRPAGRRDAGWWAPFEWLWAQKVGPNGVALYQYPGRHLSSSILGPRSRFPTVLVARAACYQYWPCRVLCWLAPSRTCPKIDVAAVGREFRRWRPDVEAIGWPMRIDLM